MHVITNRWPASKQRLKRYARQRDIELALAVWGGCCRQTQGPTCVLCRAEQQRQQQIKRRGGTETETPSRGASAIGEAKFRPAPAVNTSHIKAHSTGVVGVTVGGCVWAAAKAVAAVCDKLEVSYWLRGRIAALAHGVRVPGWGMEVAAHGSLAPTQPPQLAHPDAWGASSLRWLDHVTPNSAPVAVISVQWDALVRLQEALTLHLGEHNVSGVTGPSPGGVCVFAVAMHGGVGGCDCGTGHRGVF
jgi:hypothetical protein